MQRLEISPAEGRGTRVGDPPPAVDAHASDIGASLRTSYFPSATATKRPDHMDVREVLELIRSDTFRPQVEAIRKAPDKGTRDRLKRQLPVFCPSGTFDERKAAALSQHSGVVVVDFDGLDPDELHALRAIVQAIPHTFGAFTSPSGNGLKVLVRVPADAKRHAAAWAAVAELYAHPSLDPSGKDIARACFVSWDPDLFINEGAVELPVPEPPAPTASAIDEDRVQALLREAERRAAGHQQDTDAPLEVVLQALQPIDFRAEAGVGEGDRLPQKAEVVLVIRELRRQAEALGHPIAEIQGQPRVFSCGWWQPIDELDFASALGRAAIALGVDPIDAEHFEFQERLRKQFHTAAHLTPPPLAGGGHVHLSNGLLLITNEGFSLRPALPEDVLLHRLPYPYDPDAAAPQFRAFLDQVLPDRVVQDRAAEHFALCFVDPTALKVEQILVLSGPGGNGKSSLVNITKAAMGGEDNVVEVSLEDATRSDYHRALLGGKLLNVASEVSRNLKTDTFKRLASVEPVTVREPYKPVWTLRRYARTICTANVLPGDVEQSAGFFRRFAIVPMTVTIPPERMDGGLEARIIAAELPGVLRWILDGLMRLLRNGGLTPCPAIDEAREQYRLESDPVRAWAADVGLAPSETDRTKTRDLYDHYKGWCKDAGHQHLSISKFSPRLADLGIRLVKPNNVSTACATLNTVTDAF